MADVLILLAGFVLLIIGGEALVRGSVRVAERAGMSPLLIGITLVGFGTSAPELVTSVQASLSGSPGIAVGNIVGSNIANILLILGVTALAMPVAVGSAAISRDGTLVVATAALFNVIGLYHSLDRMVGLTLVLMLMAYLVYAYQQERIDGPAMEHTPPLEKAEALEEVQPAPLLEKGAKAPDTVLRGALMPLFLALLGLGLVVAGGKLLVDGATSIARTLGVSETVIGLTIVAVGTSMPELVTSAVAAIRRHADVALGNVMGSCIYNVLGIAGATGLMAPTTIPAEVVRYDAPVMLVASVAMLVFARTGHRLTRIEGFLLLTAYGAYIYSLWPI